MVGYNDYIYQTELYVLPVGDLFHFSAICPNLHGVPVDREWYVRLTEARHVPRRIGGMDQSRARVLKPCPVCAAVFLRLNIEGR